MTIFRCPPQMSTADPPQASGFCSLQEQGPRNEVLVLPESYSVSPVGLTTSVVLRQPELRSQA